MFEDFVQRGADPEGVRRRASPMAMCPMAKMCKAMMNKPPSGLLAMLAGAVLIAVGMLIFVEPQTLVWMVGAACAAGAAPKSFWRRSMPHAHSSPSIRGFRSLNSSNLFGRTARSFTSFSRHRSRCCTTRSIG